MREVELKKSVPPSALSGYHIYPNTGLETCGTSTSSVSLYERGYREKKGGLATRPRVDWVLIVIW